MPALGGIGLIPIRQRFDGAALADVRQAVLAQVLAPDIACRVRPGDRVAVGVGSRGICQMDVILAALLEGLKQLGAKPFLVPAMGSHGGATPRGQRDVLAGYGITEQSMGVPLDDSMDTMFLGRTEDGAPVHFSQTALQADWVLPVNRVKAHTDFSGPIESGLAKMLTIGFGKERGCTALHLCGTDRFDRLIPQACGLVLSKVRVPFGLAIVENAYDRTALVRAVKGETLLQEEELLLAQAKALMPGLPFRDIDVLIVEQFGKDVSGAGMDPNVTGRRSTGPIPGFRGPSIRQIVVLELTERSHGNAIAINAADFITRAFFDRIDLDATYKNSLACCNPASAKIPLIARDEEQALAFALACCRDLDPAAPRIVRIQSTLALERLLVSPALAEQARELPFVEFPEEESPCAQHQPTCEI